jgi:hypothetical protein
MRISGKMSVIIKVGESNVGENESLVYASASCELG